MEITNENFKQIISEAKLPVVIDFSASWCGPCRYMKPIIKEAAKDLKDIADIYSIDIDKNEGTARTLNISSVPTIILFNHDNEIYRQVGLMSKADIKNMIEKYIK